MLINSEPRPLWNVRDPQLPFKFLIQKLHQSHPNPLSHRFLNPLPSPNSKAPSKEKMAAFSSIQQHPSFLLDSDIDPHNALFPQFYEPQAAFQNLDHSTKATAISNNEASVLSVTNKNIMDSSSMVTHFYKKHDHDDYHNYYSKHLALKPFNLIGEKRKCKQGSSSNSVQSKDMREMNGKKEKKVKNSETKKKEKKNEKKETEVAPAGYIHVRARRGQATDSHSLAERVRRERISERMKLLRTLVPGCEKVTGKALMLDEIINYVQSLQNQVEFLSMKLASLNPMFYDFGMDLESFMIRPDQNLSSLPSPLPNVQQCNPTTLHNYPILQDNSVNSLVFQQPQILNQLPHEGDRSEMLMEVNDPRPNIMNQSAGFSYSLFSFH